MLYLLLSLVWWLKIDLMHTQALYKWSCLNIMFRIMLYLFLSLSYQLLCISWLGRQWMILWGIYNYNYKFINCEVEKHQEENINFKAEIRVDKENVNLFLLKLNISSECTFNMLPHIAVGKIVTNDLLNKLNPNPRANHYVCQAYLSVFFTDKH